MQHHNQNTRGRKELGLASLGPPGRLWSRKHWTPTSIQELGPCDPDEESQSLSDFYTEAQRGCMRYLTSHSSLVEGWDLDPGLPNFCPCKPPGFLRRRHLDLLGHLTNGPCGILQMPTVWSKSQPGSLQHLCPGSSSERSQMGWRWDAVCPARHHPGKQVPSQQLSRCLPGDLEAVKKSDPCAFQEKGCLKDARRPFLPSSLVKQHLLNSHL